MRVALSFVMLPEAIAQTGSTAGMGVDAAPGPSFTGRSVRSDFYYNQVDLPGALGLWPNTPIINNTRVVWHTEGGRG